MFPSQSNVPPHFAITISRVDPPSFRQATDAEGELAVPDEAWRQFAEEEPDLARKLQYGSVSEDFFPDSLELYDCPRVGEC